MNIGTTQNIRVQTYGINFPFLDGTNGEYLNMTIYPEMEIKADLIHLLLTRKGSRYFLPDFGTNLYQYVFEPMSDIVQANIQNEIKSAVSNYIPNLQINSIDITQYYDNPNYNDDISMHKLSINIQYTITSKTFSVSDTITLNF